jgi:hypothetical protein
MDTNSIDSINQEVYKRFPELLGVKPKLQKLERNILLIYQTQVRLPDAHSLNRSVRVVADDQGKIVKISTSR